MDQPTSKTHPSTPSETPWLVLPVSREGVDLTQIRALRALSPTERVRLLVDTVHRLQRLRSRVRRV